MGILHGMMRWGMTLLAVIFLVVMIIIVAAGNAPTTLPSLVGTPSATVTPSDGGHRRRC
jgi:hypothetical protein